MAGVPLLGSEFGAPTALLLIEVPSAMLSLRADRGAGTELQFTHCGVFIAGTRRVPELRVACLKTISVDRTKRAPKANIEFICILS